ncbi:MAG TPA: sterol desaturase family protein [Thermoanaerobaculia bacterium]|nr:sterol desaturase family protein [Thermoanaerobaculia bacterium]
MSALPFWLLPAVVAISFLGFSLTETVAPLRGRVESRLRRLARNATTGGVSFAVMSLLQTPLLVPVAAAVQRHQIGLLHWIELPRVWSIVVAVLLLDYTLYIWHWANHRVPFLWRFHLPHHVDRDMDASTALRFHFGELALSMPVRAAQIAIIGADPLAVAIWQTLLFAAVLFHHSNTRLPKRFESVLVRLIVTPRMHGIHHAARPDQTNSNWSSIFSFWDVLHRTFRLDVPDEEVRIGIPAYQDPRDVTLGRILTMPFRRQRDDWADCLSTETHPRA